MIKINKKQKDCKNRKEYLIRFAIAYIEHHTGFVGMDDSIFFDETECDGYALAEDLKIEFDLEEDYEYIEV